MYVCGELRVKNVGALAAVQRRTLPGLAPDSGGVSGGHWVPSLRSYWCSQGLHTYALLYHSLTTGHHYLHVKGVIEASGSTAVSLTTNADIPQLMDVALLIS